MHHPLPPSLTQPKLFNINIKGKRQENGTKSDVVIQYLSKESDILFCSITPTNLGQLSKPGTVLKSARPEDSKTVPES